MDASRREVQEPKVVPALRLGVSHTVFSLLQNPKEVGFNASEGENVPARERASRPKAKASFSRVLYVGCHQKGWAIFSVDFPTSNDSVKKNPLTDVRRSSDFS